MSNLVIHAKRELKLLGEDDDVIAGYLRVIRAFAAMGHSGGSASVSIPVIEQLLRYQNLTPLTDDPAEWIYHTPDVWGAKNGKGIWQNTRNSAAFSEDEGKTYYLVYAKKRRVLGRRKHKTKRVRKEEVPDE